MTGKMMMLFQAKLLNDSLGPINSSVITSITEQLVNITAVGSGGEPTVMSAAELSASIEVMLRVALVYSFRRRSLILHQSTMDVSSCLLLTHFW